MKPGFGGLIQGQIYNPDLGLQNSVVRLKFDLRIVCLLCKKLIIRKIKLLDTPMKNQTYSFRSFPAKVWDSNKIWSNETKGCSKYQMAICVCPKMWGKPPKWMVKIMVPNPMNKWMIWGGFATTPIFGATTI